MCLAPPVAFLPLPATQEWGEGVLRFTKQILPHWGHWGRGARAWDHETFHEPGSAGILAGVAVRTQYAGRDARAPNDSPVHGR